MNLGYYYPMVKFHSRIDRCDLPTNLEYYYLEIKTGDLLTL